MYSGDLCVSFGFVSLEVIVMVLLPQYLNPFGRKLCVCMCVCVIRLKGFRYCGSSTITMPSNTPQVANEMKPSVKQLELNHAIRRAYALMEDYAEDVEGDMRYGRAWWFRIIREQRHLRLFEMFED